ncbi:hypothetical protein GQ42DRAFT_162409, partial [Ramicandelaber brevisporus]
MRFTAVAALLAASSAAVSAVNISYGSRGVVPVNYGVCNEAKATPETLVSLESTAGDFTCNIVDYNTVSCYGTQKPYKACKRLRNRCISYGGVFDDDACGWAT